LVPGVDDGAGTHGEALRILERMGTEYPAGSTVVLTPHFTAYMPGRVARGKSDSAIRFIEGAEKLTHLRLMAAGELMLSGFALENLERCRYPGTGHVLIEFFSGITWMETLLQVRRVLRRGYRPLLAHPERYHWCRGRSDRLVKLSRMGCGVLVSARSLQNRKHAPEARRLLEGGFAHGLCSDAHSDRDAILGEKLRSGLAPDILVPWEVYTWEIPSMILEDLPLPELPLRKEDW